MIIFWLIAGAMTLFALAVLVPNLWRSETSKVAEQQSANVAIVDEQLSQLEVLHKSGEIDQHEFDERKTELELALALSLDANTPVVQSTGADNWISSGRILGVFILLALPVSAYVLYQYIGTPNALNPEFIASQSVAEDQQVASIDELLPRLEEHLAQSPDDVRGWRLLGVTYLRLQRFDDASMALEKALALTPDDPDVMLQLADAKAMSVGGKLAGEPVQLVENALAIVPENPQGLWLLGMYHREQNEHEPALEIWEKLSGLLQQDPKAREEVLALAKESRVALGIEEEAAQTQANVTTATQSENKVSASKSIVVNVGIDPSIAAKVAPEHSVFIYAKAVSGPPMPLAVTKKTVADLPIELVLDDSLAMVAGMTLSSFDEVVVGARISLSGNPVAQPGDFYAEVQPVKPGQSAPVLLNIESVVP